MIVLADSSPLITLARARHFDLLRKFYGEIVVSHEVYTEIAVAGAGLPGAEEIQRAPWINVQTAPHVSSQKLEVACRSLGPGERSIIYLASTLNAGLVLIDEDRARRAARGAGLKIAGSIAILERGAKMGHVDDLRAVFLNLLEQGIRYDRRLLNASLERLGLTRLDL